MTRSQRKFVNHTLMVGIILIMLTMVILLSQRQRHTAAPESPAAGTFAPAPEVKKATGITSIAYSDGSTTLAFSRSEDGIWHWDADPAFPLDLAVIDAMTASVAPLQPQKLILHQSEALDNYGLGSDTTWFTAVYEDGTQLRLDFGDPVPDSTNHYALKDGDTETVYILPNDIPARMSIAVYDMMALPHPPALEEADFSSVTVQGATETVMIAFKTGAKHADNAAADPSAVAAAEKVTWLCNGEDITENPLRKELVSALSGITLSKCENFHPSDNAVTLWGLDDPVAVANITYGTDQLLTLQIGSKTLKGDGYYVRINEDTAIYSISNDTLAPILTVAEKGLSAEPDAETPADTGTGEPAGTDSDLPAA